MISNTIVCPPGYTDIRGKCVKIPDAEDDMDYVPDYLPELGVPDMFPDYLQPQIPDIVPDFNRPNRPDIPDFNRPDIIPDFPNVSDFEDLIDEGYGATVEPCLKGHGAAPEGSLSWRDLATASALPFIIPGLSTPNIVCAQYDDDDDDDAS